MSITIPASGSGTATPEVATEQIGTPHYQQIKLTDPTTGSTQGHGIAANPIRTLETKPASAAVSATVVSTAAQTLLSSNTARRGASFFNEVQTGVLNLKLGSAPTTGLYTVQLQPGALYELPEPVYLGVVTGLWSSTSTAGNAMVTELTA